ncbi:LCP family protein [Patescibacteria group bacterium]|nr:LCP family protein [Patescibacteria group bacterium]
MFENILKKKNNSEEIRITRLADLNRSYRENGKKRIIKKAVLGIIAIVFIAGIWYGARANQAMENISINDGSFIQRILRLLPLDNSFIFQLPVETSILEEPDTIEKRVNFLILGMRGKDDPDGGLLADSSIIVSVRPFDSKIALISIPRDLFVFMPGLNGNRKLNEAYEIGEKQTPGKGLEYAKSIFSNISGAPIHFAVIVNFKAFKDLIDSLGGVELNLEKPFVEAVPFEEGSISLPAGRQIIDGDTALLYTRARMSSSDFDRSRRQQEVFKAIYGKITKTGIILNPYRLNKLLNIMEANTRTDMQVWEMQEVLKLFSRLKDPSIKTKVIDTGSENLLYSTLNGEKSFILLPIGDDYAKIHETIKNIFN